MTHSENGPHETSAASGPGALPARPTWVKVCGILLAVIVVAAIVMALAGSDHGPGRHSPDGDAGGHAPPVQHDS